ncbi:hypothetical protein FQN51_004814 [Onygenales sp. PD_10]|nr:hypothetical protein FQN51_004814 [Onygenales sp. PD_10]
MCLAWGYPYKSYVIEDPDKKKKEEKKKEKEEKEKKEKEEEEKKKREIWVVNPWSTTISSMAGQIIWNHVPPQNPAHPLHAQFLGQSSVNGWITAPGQGMMMAGVSVAAGVQQPARRSQRVQHQTNIHNHGNAVFINNAPAAPGGGTPAPRPVVLQQPQATLTTAQYVGQGQLMGQAQLMGNAPLIGQAQLMGNAGGGGAGIQIQAVQGQAPAAPAAAAGPQVLWFGPPAQQANAQAQPAQNAPPQNAQAQNQPAAPQVLAVDPNGNNLVPANVVQPGANHKWVRTADGLWTYYTVAEIANLHGTWMNSPEGALYFQITNP